LLGDANFPAAISKAPRGAQIRLYEELYKQYSGLGLTRDYDRPLAIFGLEKRLIIALGTRGGYGVFQKYFERSLLWRRGKLSRALTKIDFPPEQQFRVPSWSWMAYKQVKSPNMENEPESIDFVDAPFGKMDWPAEVRSPWEKIASTSSLHTADASVSNELHGDARDFDSPESNEELWYDNKKRPSAQRTVKCVIVGKEKLSGSIDAAEQRHYVLIVALKLAARNGMDYERIGVGILPASSIILDEMPQKIQIT